MKEEQIMTSYESAGQKPAGLDTFLTSLALILFPAIVLVAMFIVPMASGGDDPSGDEANLAERAEDTGRWVAGYSLMALGWGIGMLGIAGLGGIIRRSGATALGTVGPGLFALGAIGIIAGGHGAVGIGLGATVDAGGDGVAYLEADSQVGILYSWLGGIAAGLGLLTTAAGIWRAGLLDGRARIACVVCLAIGAIIFGMLTGHGVNVVALAGPIATLAGFGLVVWRMNMADGASVAPGVRQPA
jgi:hypothetical protein